MMLQSIDKKKIYFYIILLLILVSTHNLEAIKFTNSYFNIQKITVSNNIDKNLNYEITNSLNKFKNYNIFLLNQNEIVEIIEKYNVISEYKVYKEYPSSVNIYLKETNILAYYFDKNKKTYIGENGKKITRNEFNFKDIPLVVGDVDISAFLDLIKKLKKNGFKHDDFVKFYSFKSNRWDLTYKNNLIFKLPQEDLDSSLILLKNIIENKNIDDVKIIDLRIKNKIILS